MNETEAKPHWKCSKCGYILTAPQPPEVCPECKEIYEGLPMGGKGGDGKGGGSDEGGGGSGG